MKIWMGWWPAPGKPGKTPPPPPSAGLLDARVVCSTSGQTRAPPGKEDKLRGPPDGHSGFLVLRLRAELSSVDESGVMALLVSGTDFFPPLSDLQTTSGPRAPCTQSLLALDRDTDDEPREEEPLEAPPAPGDLAAPELDTRKALGPEPMKRNGDAGPAVAVKADGAVREGLWLLLLLPLLLAAASHLKRMCALRVFGYWKVVWQAVQV